MKYVPATMEETTQDVSIIDMSNPRSIINLVSGKVKEHILALDPELIGQQEKSLEQWFRRKHIEIDEVDHRLRLSFWEVYYLTQDRNLASIDLSKVTRGVCSRDYFYDRFLTDPRKLAWMLCPPTDYMKQLKDINYRVYRKLSGMLELPIVTSKGEPNTKFIGQLLKVAEMTDTRIRGAVVQKLQVEQQNLNVNMDASPSNPQDIEAIDAELARLEGREVKKIGSEVIDAQATRVPEEEKEVGSAEEEGGS